jgi:hypothetical protein
MEAVVKGVVNGAGTTATRPRAQRGPLWPREHGAYGQLGLPLVAALALGSPTLTSGLLVTGAVAAFVAHEPLLVWLGARGTRARREHGARAAWLGLSLAVGALALGGVAMALGGRVIVLASLVPLALTAGVLPFVLTGREKSTPGELLAGVALASASIPVSIAAGVSPFVAAIACATWAIALTAGTAAVRWVIARHRVGKSDATLLAVLSATTAAGTALATRYPIALAAAPMVLAAWFLVAFPPHPRHLRRVGWTLVGSSTATAVLIVAIGRMTG